MLPWFLLAAGFWLAFINQLRTGIAFGNVSGRWHRETSPDRFSAAVAFTLVLALLATIAFSIVLQFNLSFLR